MRTVYAQVGLHTLVLRVTRSLWPTFNPAPSGAKTRGMRLALTNLKNSESLYFQINRKSNNYRPLLMGSRPPLLSGHHFWSRQTVQTFTRTCILTRNLSTDVFETQKATGRRMKCFWRASTNFSKSLSTLK